MRPFQWKGWLRTYHAFLVTFTFDGCPFSSHLVRCARSTGKLPALIKEVATPLVGEFGSFCKLPLFLG